MKYLSLEVAPQTLSQTTVDQFNRLVSDPLNYPLFVYDKDGSLAGGLWYLYFRTVERTTDSEARKRAQRLGLRDDPQRRQPRNVDRNSEAAEHSRRPLKRRRRNRLTRSQRRRRSFAVSASSGSNKPAPTLH